MVIRDPKFRPGQIVRLLLPVQEIGAQPIRCMVTVPQYELYPDGTSAWKYALSWITDGGNHTSVDASEKWIEAEGGEEG